jgi:hypothetical protein
MSEPHRVSEPGTACLNDYPGCIGCSYKIRGCPGYRLYRVDGATLLAKAPEFIGKFPPVEELLLGEYAQMDACMTMKLHEEHQRMRPWYVVLFRDGLRAFWRRLRYHWITWRNRRKKHGRRFPFEVEETTVRLFNEKRDER